MSCIMEANEPEMEPERVEKIYKNIFNLSILNLHWVPNERNWDLTLFLDSFRELIIRYEV